MDEHKSKAKKMNPGLIIGIIVGALVVAGIAGVAASQYFARKNAETAINNLTNGEVSTKDGTTKISDGKTSTIVSESGQKWPSDLPENAPEFKYGTVKAVTSNPSEAYWSIILENVSDDANTKYQADLAGAGWTSDAEVQFVVSILQYKKGDYILNATYDSSSNGEVITITKKVE